METRITTPEILACIDCWIAYNCIHVKNVNKDTPHTGYLRHAFEADVGIHISNEDFALAMYRADKLDIRFFELSSFFFFSSESS